MMKSQPSATKLRLSSLFRWLAVICLIKLVVLGFVLPDISLPVFFGNDAADATHSPDTSGTTSTPATASEAAAVQSIAQNQALGTNAPLTTPATPNAQLAPGTSATAYYPQGIEAARLAAAIKPRAGAAHLSEAPMPRALQTPPTANAPTAYFTAADMAALYPQNASFAINAAPITPASPTTSVPQLAEPAPLPAPAAITLAEAPVTRAAAPDENPHSPSLRRLPVPGLGSVRAAHAASLDIPVPQASQTPVASPFAPPEQGAPLTVPGAPPVPAGIPRGQGNDGAPLPPRGVSSYGTGLPALPASPSSVSAPAPIVTPNIAPADPNAAAQDLARQQQDLLMLRQQMDQRLKDLQNAEKKVKEMIREAKGLEDKKMRSLVQMYSNMKPKVAAKALESMEDRIAVRILSDMPPKQSGEILTYTNPVKTAKFTELITRMKVPQ